MISWFWVQNETKFITDMYQIYRINSNERYGALVHIDHVGHGGVLLAVNTLATLTSIKVIMAPINDPTCVIPPHHIKPFRPSSLKIDATVTLT